MIHGRTPAPFGLATARQPLARGRRMMRRIAVALLALIGGAALLAAAGGYGTLGRKPNPAPNHGPRYRGVNLAGAEFAPDDPDATYGRNYIYPDAAVAQPFAAKGMSVVRVPITWERIQPWPQAMLSPIESDRLDKALDALTGFELAIIDVHNYAKYQGTRLANDEHSAALLADLWTRLAQRYRDRPNVAFGIMNEPNEIDPRVWRTIVDRVVLAIRGTGARNLILVPGANWTTAANWSGGGAASNAAAFAGFRDPAGNSAFEMHQYLDGNSGGSSDSCVARAVAIDRLRDATDWLRAQNARGFLGEFAAGTSPQCLDSLDGLLATMQANGDVWMGWTYWAGGPWWGDSWTSVQPDKDGKDKPQMAILERYVGRH